jgi:neutral ceramidase
VKLVRPLLLLLVLGGCATRPGGDDDFQAGEGTADVTPPTGTELAGFHKPAGQERRARGVRQPSSARVLLLATRAGEFALVSLDVCAVSQEFARDVKAELARSAGLRPDHVRVCATHTHSMPTLRHFRQWGGLPADYAALVSQRIVEAAVQARRDLAPARFLLGKERVAGGNFNRTTKTWKTDDLFGKDSAAEQDRWLDTTLHALVFARDHRQPLVWYQFSAHPVCYTDGDSGPDWPGLVADALQKTDRFSPSFLQGHCGDVNPGSGNPWLGDPRKVCDAVADALRRAVRLARPIAVPTVRHVIGEFAVPLDLAKEQELLAKHRADPSACTKGEWVDAGFSKAWSEVASAWDPARTAYRTPMSALRLGDVALLFHSGELYSGYGLALRRDSPFADTILVGYADDLIGYVPDPKAYEAGEYAATVVPKIMDLPRFQTSVGRAFTETALSLLRKLGD